MNKPIICLFSMMLFASVLSFPIQPNNDLSALPEIDDFIPSDDQIVNHKEEPTLINDDDEWDDQDISEEEDLAPPSSAGISNKPARIATTFKPNNFHSHINCYTECKKNALYICSTVLDNQYSKLTVSEKYYCDLKCKKNSLCN